MSKTVDTAFSASLDAHLKKCELKYRAKECPQGSNVNWLAPFCNSTDQIATYLRQLGFKIKEIVDEEPWPEELHQWVITTSGIIVYVNTPYTEGLVAQCCTK